MSDSENKAIQLVESAIKLPGVKVDRREFLTKTFKNVTANELSTILEQGPQAVISTMELNKKASGIINATVNKSSTASFAAGLASNPLVMAGTFSADLAQYYAFALRMAQQLGYIYGIEDLFDESGNITENGNDVLMLYLGTMLAVSGANAGLMVVAKSASKQVSKTVMKTAMTRTIWYPFIKNIAKNIGINVTKKGTASLFSKAVPIIGGAISGGLTYATMKPMGKKLKLALSETLNATSADLEEAINTINKEFNN